MEDNERKEQKVVGRKELISFFKKGRLPTEDHFEKLIESNFNKADDLLDISAEEGFLIYPTSGGKLLSFYQKKAKEEPAYTIFISPEGGSPNGLFIEEQGQAYDNSSKKDAEHGAPEFFIERGSGNIGVGINKPRQKLDVNGRIKSKGRVGKFAEGYVPADGDWHNVFEDNLTNVNAYEVMAFAKGKKGEGRYSLLHAIAVCTFAKSDITKTVSHVDKNYNKIKIRWVSKPSRIKEGQKGSKVKKKRYWEILWDWFMGNDKADSRNPEYNLQLKTNSHYGKNEGEVDELKLYYKISELWSPEFIPTIDELKRQEALEQNEND